jgi:hypothetical protein
MEMLGLPSQEGGGIGDELTASESSTIWLGELGDSRPFQKAN